VPGQAAEPWAVWFAAAEAELVPIDQAVPGPDSAEEGWDVRVALGPVLKSLAAWFVALEVAAFDRRLEAAAEAELVRIVRAALVQVSATQVSVSQALFVQAFFAPSPAAEAPV